MAGKYQFQPGGLLMPGAPRPPWHPFSKLFPMIEKDDERAVLRASLADGQNHPIVLHKGMLLDGRNRERELFELKKPVRFEVFVGDDRQALRYVFDENIVRRHLEESRRALLGAEIAAKLKLGDNQHTRTAQPAQICAPSLFEDD